MLCNLIIRPEAEKDINEAFDWYEQQNKGLGQHFILCLDASMSAIQRTPRLYAKIHKNIRRMLVRKFPYGIYYLVAGNNIIVLSVFHAKRNPTHWQTRLPARRPNQ